MSQPNKALDVSQPDKAPDAAPSKEIPLEIKSAIHKQIPRVKNATELCSGGSGTIYTLFIDDMPESCLKVVKCSRCYNIDEHIKALRELYLLLKINESAKSAHVVPVLNKNLEKPGADKVSAYLNELEHIIANSSKLTLENLGSTLDSLKDIVFVCQHNTHVHIGFITESGYSLEKLLEYLADKINKKENVTAPNWVKITVEKGGRYDVEQYKVDQLLFDLTDDILSAMKHMHSCNMVHLDIKESNILALKSPDGKRLRFVLFDLGSAIKIIDGKPDRAEFQATYQYLPKVLQRANPMSHFTSHNRVPLHLDKIPAELTLYQLDLHALSCIILNFLTNERIKRISARIHYKAFEFYFSFAQIISVDFKEDDADSVLRGNDDVHLAERAYALYFDSLKTWTDAILDWNDWVSAYAKRPHPSMTGVGHEIPYDERQYFPHPASRLYVAECKKVIERLLSQPKEKDVDEKIFEQVRLLEASKKTKQDWRIIDENLEEIRNKFAAQVLNDIRSMKIASCDMSPLLNVKLLTRLKKIKQLALTHIIPPEPGLWYAQHNRFDHSIGALEIARLYLMSLLKNSGWFRLRYDMFDGVCLLIVALLHDIGHYPCAHYLEDTRIFKKHTEVTKALLTWDLAYCRLDTSSDLKVIEGSAFSGILGRRRFAEHPSACQDKHDSPACHLRICDIQDFIELHAAIAKILDGRYDEFFNWVTEFYAQSDRLIFKVMRGIISGPIDVDKMHYIVNDSLNCGTSIAAIFEGNDFKTLVENLRIPIRYRQDSGTESFCLGVNEEYAHLAQLVMILRASMYNQVYWSSNARCATVLLRHIIIDSFRSLMQQKRLTLPIEKLIGDWMRQGDDKIEELSCSIAKQAETDDPAPLRLSGLAELLFNPTSDAPPYIELCRIYPTDKVAYAKLLREIEDLQIGQETLHCPTGTILSEIRKIVARNLYLADEKLPYGSVLMDIPMQHTSKRKEFTNFAIVGKQGFGRPAGEVWEAIEDDFDKNSRVIRILIKSGIVAIDREDSVLIRAAIVSKFS